MKYVLIAFALAFTGASYAKKTETSIKELQDKRMIAGKFEGAEKKAPKKVYLDDLRSKLLGSKGFTRF